MSRTIMTNVRIVDGTGAAAIEKGAFVMHHVTDAHDKDYIEFIGPMEDFEPSRFGGDISKALDLPGYTLLPGLINVHSHLDIELPYLPYLADLFGDSYRALVGYRRAAEALLCGVTTVRNVGGAGDFDLALRKAIEKNMMWGPRIVACGSPIAPHAGHGNTIPGTLLCSGKTEFLKAVRHNIERGVDQVKLMYTGGLAGASEGLYDEQITEEELAVAIAAAHGAEKPVAAHLSHDKAIRLSVELGIDTVEHAYQLTEETARLMAEKGTWLVPTLCVSNAQEYLGKHGAPAYVLEKLGQSAQVHKASIQNAIRAGVSIATGTDLLPSDKLDGAFATVREAELLVDAGLTPLEAIRAATLNGAALCGIDDVTGSLAAGKQGDIIVVEGAPDKNIADLRNLRLVARGCRLTWSELPGLELRRFHILPPGCEVEGGTFERWS